MCGVSMKLEYFRLILTEDSQLKLLSEYKDRTEAIKNIFSQNFEFRTSHNKEFKYRYKSTDNGYILGLIFEKQNVKLLEDPDNTEFQKRPNWKPQVVVINDGAIKGDNSQLFLFEHSSHYNVTDRLSLLNNSLADKLNQFLKEKNSQYSAQFTPVLEIKNFWELSSRNDLKELIIDYAMPNFYGITDGAKRLNELSKIKQKTNADSFKQIISNKNGNLILDANDEDLKETIELTKIGQSSIIVKNINKTVIYNSAENETIKTASISVEEIDIQSQNSTEANATLKTMLEGLNL